jgi:hypothetical protein
MSEFLFGLITVLTFTTTFDVSGFGRGNVHNMLLAALGRNLAWGVIDLLNEEFLSTLYRTSRA